MLDKKAFAEQKEHREQREAMQSLAEGDEIAKNLKRFANARPDLYQDVQVKPEELVSSKAVAPTVIFDGQSRQLTRTHANVAMMQN